jgi:hypothetical protein
MCCRRQLAARGSGCASTGCRPSEGRPKQAVDLLPHLLAREAFAELELDQTHEKRIERAPGGQELLRDLREWLVGGDHPCEGGDLAARALGVTDGGAAFSAGVQ